MKEGSMPETPEGGRLHAPGGEITIDGREKKMIDLMTMIMALTLALGSFATATGLALVRGNDNNRAMNGRIDECKTPCDINDPKCVCGPTK